MLKSAPRGSRDSIEIAFDFVLRAHVGLQAEHHLAITNNAFAYGTSEQRQAIGKIITVDTSSKLTSGERTGVLRCVHGFLVGTGLVRGWGDG